MSLRDLIAYEIYKQDRAISATMSFEDFVSNQSLFIIGLRLVADAILALPEMQEMREQNKVLVSLARAIQKFTGSSNIDDLSKIGEWKEKAEKCDEHFKAIVEMEQEITEYKEKAERFDSIKDMFPDFLEHGKEWKEKAAQVDKYEKYIADWNEVEEWKEKAEKWDISRNLIKNSVLSDVLSKAEQLDLIMKNLKVREKCEAPKHMMDVLSSHEGCICHGTGTIVRDATPEEVNEFIEAMFGNVPFDVVHFRQYSEFKLKSGAILFMENI